MILQSIHDISGTESVRLEALGRANYYPPWRDNLPESSTTTPQPNNHHSIPGKVAVSQHENGFHHTQGGGVLTLFFMEARVRRPIISASTRFDASHSPNSSLS